MGITIPTREQLGLLDQRAEWEHEVAQWEQADGTKRGVVLRALSPQDRMDAELAAVGEVRKGVYEVNEWVRMCQEVARGIARPAHIPPEVVATWNEAVVRGIHAQLQIVAYMAPALIAAARDAALGGPAPEATAPPRRRSQPARPRVAAGDEPPPGGAAA